MEGDDRGVLLLAAEPAAGLRLDDLGLLPGEPEGSLQRLVDVVRALERAVDLDTAVLAGRRDHRVVLDVELLLVADAVRPFEDDVGGGEAGRDVPRVDLVVREDVLALEGVEDRSERLSPDLHVATGGTELLAVGGGEEDERLGMVLDLATDRDCRRGCRPR